MQEIILLPKIIQVVNLFCIFRCMHVFSEFSSPTKTSGYGLNSNYSTKSFDSSNASSLLYFSTSALPGKKHQERPHLFKFKLQYFVFVHRTANFFCCCYKLF